MPRICIIDPMGTWYRIDTQNTRTLSAWFDEILPRTYIKGRPHIDNFAILYPRIQIEPMWDSSNQNPDWVCNTRVLGRIIEFKAVNAIEGMEELARIRREMVTEIGYGDT
jgi:hypothetical protein